MRSLLLVKARARAFGSRTLLARRRGNAAGSSINAAAESAQRACVRLRASVSRFLGRAVVTSEPSRARDAAATSSTARANAASFATEGAADPLIFLTYCRAAARISSSVAGGSKLYSVLMFLHTSLTSRFRPRPCGPDILSRRSPGRPRSRSRDRRAGGSETPRPAASAGCRIRSGRASERRRGRSRPVAALAGRVAIRPAACCGHPAVGLSVPLVPAPRTRCPRCPGRAFDEDLTLT